MAKLSMQDREAIISLEAVREALSELEALGHAKEDAGVTFSAGIEAVAVKAGIEPAVLKRFVQARVKDTAKKLAIQAAQMQLLFDEFGRPA